MTSRILIADDSLTIQKVIGITLASSGYELVESLNEAGLFKKIQSNHFDLVLLDFNLSDSVSGYDLAKKVHKIIPNAAIVVMLGTFDTVDDLQFEECGIADKIVKPFESTKFIKKCRDLLEGNRTEVLGLKEKNLSEEFRYSKAEDLDSWTVDAPQVHSHDQVEKKENSTPDQERESALDPLSSEIEGWGFTPSNAVEEKFQKVFPPVIEEASEVKIIDRLQSSSQFIQFVDDDQFEETEKLDVTDPVFEVPQNFNRDLASEIDDDVSVETFWAVDEVVPRKSEEEEDISKTNLDDVTADLTETVQAFKNKELKQESGPVLGGEHCNHSMIDQDAIVEKLKVAIKPLLEEIVKEYCRASAEKIAWEVIPDLAENIIRKEIKEISDSVLS